MKFCVLMAFYDKGNKFRERNLSEVVDRYLTTDDFDVIIAEQYPQGFAETLSKEHPDRVKFVSCNDMKGDPGKKGRFCKTELLNTAVNAYPDYEYYVMGDADAYLSEECFNSLRDAVPRLDSGEAAIVFPFNDVLYLNEPDTKRIVSNEDLLPGSKNHGAEIFRQTGLCNIFKKSTWDAVGGFDEDFTNWGAEDDAFLTKCKRLVGRSLRLSGTVYHLFHPKVDTDTYRKSKDYLENRKRCACLRRMSDEDLMEYCIGNTTLSSLVEKYEKMGRLSVELKWQCTPECILTIDTTMYDIDMTGEMSFTKLLDAVAAESEIGRLYIPIFIDNYLGEYANIPGLSVSQRLELMEYVKKCSLLKT